ncbi:hypothetical protein Hanom_Chr09g00838271 [Helianthus anomalus]
MKLPSTIVISSTIHQICPQNSRPFLNSSNIWLISTQQPQMAFSCSGLTLKLHVLERPYCVQRWCDEKGNTNLSFFFMSLYTNC